MVQATTTIGRRIDGTFGNDELGGTSGDDQIYGQDGNDTLYGNGGNDRLYGGNGNDNLYGGTRYDQALSAWVIDSHDSYYDGGAGDDLVIAGAGNDMVQGGDGNDRIYGGGGADLLLGGAGDDRIYSSEIWDPVTKTFSGDYMGDLLDGGAGDDLLYGGKGNDILDGGSGRNLLFGYDGNDHYVIRNLGDVVWESAGIDSGLIRVNWYKPNPEVENWVWAPGVEKLPYWLDALTFSDAPDLGYTISRDKTIHYSFAQATSSWFTTNDKTGFVPFTADQISYTRKMLAYIETVLDVHFVEASDADTPYTIVFANNEQELSGGYGNMLRKDHGSTVMFDNAARALAPSKDNGAAFMYVALHEVGHALGLKHPFGHQDAVGDTGQGPFLTNAEDAKATTLMSYTGLPADFNAYSAFDIAALQYLYGAAPTMQAGDTRYVVDGSRSLMIGDGAGIDTLDGSGQAQAMSLYLEPGYWSYVGAKADLISAPGQLTVNFGTVIENALGGSGADRIVGNAVANAIDGGAGDDVLEGGAGNDTLSGGLGDDRLGAGSGDDRLDGGAGLDAAVYTGARAGFSITRGADGWIVTGSASDQGRDTLTGIERIVFGDGAIALDVDGVAAAAYRLYAAAFDRKPDLAGMGYWIKAMDQGISLQEVASAFARTDEFTQKYGASHTMESFLVKMYQNVLHRVPDQAGLEYWIGSMTGGTTEAEVLAAFSVSAENRAQVIGQIENGIDYVPFA